MSFALTTAQIMDGTKTVTRRLGWLHARPGQQVRPVRKCMGLRPGEKLDVLRDPLIVVSVRREPLRAMTDDVEYGCRECDLEGFGAHPDYRWPSAFVAMFCATHKGCTPETTVTRIEFAYHQDDGRLHEDLGTVGAVLGHKSQATTRRYAHHGTQRLAEALAKIRKRA